MKKKLLLVFILVFLVGNAYAKYRPAVIFKHDGSQIDCLAEYPNDVNSKKINFKMTKDAKSQKIESPDIKLIRYLDNDQVVEIEYNHQITYNNARKDNPKVSAPAWMNVIIRGPVTLYLITIITQTRNGARITENYYYCKREDERAATCVSLGKGIHIGSQFPKIGAKYFSDSPHIAEKIRNKEKGYASRNIEEIVNEYNAEEIVKGK